MSALDIVTPDGAAKPVEAMAARIVAIGVSKASTPIIDTDVCRSPKKLAEMFLEALAAVAAAGAVAPVAVVLLESYGLKEDGRGATHAVYVFKKIAEALRAS
jgi:hypothetical protein